MIFVITIAAAFLVRRNEIGYARSRRYEISDEQLDKEEEILAGFLGILKSRPPRRIVGAKCAMILSALPAGPPRFNSGGRNSFLIGFAVLPIPGFLKHPGRQSLLPHRATIDGQERALESSASSASSSSPTSRAAARPLQFNRDVIAAATGFGAALAAGITGFIMQRSSVNGFIFRALVAPGNSFYFMPETLRVGEKRAPASR